MKNIIYIMALLLLSSCKVQVPQKITSGTFRYIYKSDGEVEYLILKEDGSFIFRLYGTECDGNWQYIKKNTILISCRNPSIVETISRGYMSQRARKIRILNNNKIKVPIMNNIKRKYLIMKRVY